MLSKDVEDKVTELVREELVGICKLHKLDYYTLPKEIRSAMISIFQSGVGFEDKFKV